MFDKKEMVAIGLSSVFLGFALSIGYFLNAATGIIEDANYIGAFLTVFLFVLVILLVNSFAKKIAAYYFDSNLKVKIWEIGQWGYKPSHYFKTPFSAGIVVPLVTSFVSLGYFVWFSPLTFDAESAKARVAKRHGSNPYYEMKEFEIGIIAAIGLFANLFFAYIAYLIGFSELSRLSLYFVVFNVIPFHDLDGAKIIFGSKLLWAVMVVLSIIGFLIAALAF